MNNEAEYKGRDVDLNKPMRGDQKKYKVYVKDQETGNIKKVNFGDKNMEIKRDDPERRKSFRARHKCDTAKDKTTPRYWSCKFWSTKNVSDLLKEIIDPNDIDMSSIQFHDQLNPMIWGEDGKLKEDVRKTLLKTAKKFIEYSDFENIKFNDIILVGSIANFNYNENSDIDLHILFDFNQISENKEFVDDYTKMKKNMWNSTFPIQIKGYDVELYYEDIDEKNVSSGSYSLIRNEWINEPTKKIVNIDVSNIKKKTGEIMHQIDDLHKIKDLNVFVKKYNQLKDKIKKMRKCGLEKEGEFSTENLSFKLLRNNGYLEKMVDLKNNYITKELSLDENK